MHVFLSASILLLCTGTFADYSGLSTYPPPRDLSSEESIVAPAWTNLSSTLDAILQQQQNASSNLTTALPGLARVTFSMGLFSLHDPEATKLQYHYTSSQIGGSEHGAKSVAADSIYRVASVSKLITVFAGLVRLSDEEWNTPLTEIFPGLRDVNAVTELQNAPQWDAITPWMLASQISGIGASGPLTDLLSTFAFQALTQNTSMEDLQPAVQALAAAAGLPPVSLDIFGACLVVDCSSTADFIKSIGGSPPVFQPWTTPGYSNLGFFILGQVLLNATGRGYADYEGLYHDAIFGPLNMSSTYLNSPRANDTAFARSVIAGPEMDEARRSHRKHDVLSRCTLGDCSIRESHKRQVTDIYTKLGDSGSYSGMLAVIPEYNAGYTYLSAYYAEPGTDTEALRSTVALGTINELVEAIMPALEAQAAKEAEENFVGTYIANDDAVNSTFVVSQRKMGNATSGIGAGLVIEQWISNGTNAFLTFSGQIPRLLPAIVAECSSPREVTFQVDVVPQWNSYTAAGMGPLTGFYDSNLGWFAFDGTGYGGRYGGSGIGTFVFELDGRGKAIAATHAAASVKMVKQRQTESQD